MVLEPEKSKTEEHLARTLLCHPMEKVQREGKRKQELELAASSPFITGINLFMKEEPSWSKLD
jgi:hypothetical protein